MAKYRSCIAISTASAFGALQLPTMSMASGVYKPLPSAARVQGLRPRRLRRHFNAAPRLIDRL
eukprot:2694691-Pleurochrysis_carterae.AAC.1